MRERMSFALDVCVTTSSGGIGGADHPIQPVVAVLRGEDPRAVDDLGLADHAPARVIGPRRPAGGVIQSGAVAALIDARIIGECVFAYFSGKTLSESLSRPNIHLIFCGTISPS